MKTKTEIKNALITAGIKKLQESGYRYVNNENIMTDIIYMKFFKNMLESNRGNGNEIDDVIDELINELNY